MMPRRESRFDCWMQEHCGGHISLGNGRRVRLVIYGYNAMHVAVNLWLFKTWICFHPPWKVFGHWWKWYFYISPDATPCSATFRLGHHYD